MARTPGNLCGYLARGLLFHVFHQLFRLFFHHIREIIGNQYLNKTNEKQAGFLHSRFLGCDATTLQHRYVTSQKSARFPRNAITGKESVGTDFHRCPQVLLVFSTECTIGMVDQTLGS